MVYMYYSFLIHSSADGHLGFVLDPLKWFRVTPKPPGVTVGLASICTHSLESYWSLGDDESPCSQ